ncbi:flavin reductase family protein [Mycolicibacterium goodii]|uniref:flavin reductase family protein n=1 Tax=Mycolicibacterium goodii TaxID=134601 RepID=UPI001BDD8368|nr:flavin reductase family protein [Mycolicibacterium goodii]MBU8828779.1 flavin reductase family protein [Mycolicibacterium goodii]
MKTLTEIRSGDGAEDMSRLRRLYGRYPTGVAAICALRDGQPVGIVATSFIPVSMSPALVSICVQHTSTTWPQLSRDERLGISVLAEGHAQLSRQLAVKNADRFAGLSWFASDSSAVFLADAAAWLDCRISTSITAGDHDVVLMEVISAADDETISPLVFHESRFRTMSDHDKPR